MAYPGKVLAALTAGTYQMRIGPSYAAFDADYDAFGAKWPFLLFIGPSGNVSRLPAPQQMEDWDYHTNPIEYPNLSPSGWRGSSLLATNCIEWAGNELVFVVDKMAWGYHHVYAFCPGTVGPRLIQPLEKPAPASYQQTEPTTDVRTGLGMSWGISTEWPKIYGNVVQDGTYYKKIHRNTGGYGLTSLLTICDRVHFVYSNLTSTNRGMQGYVQAYSPHSQLKFFSSDWCTRFNQGIYSPSGYLSIVEGFDTPWNCDAVQGTFENDTTLYGANRLVRIDAQNNYANFDTYLQTQTIYHGGLLYATKECVVSATRPACVCGYGLTPLLIEGSEDIPIFWSIYRDTTYSHYVNHSPLPYQQTPFDARYKCPTIDGNKLYILQNDGRLLQVTNGEVIEIVDIKEQLQLTSNYASGIYGGNIKTGGHYEEEDGSASVYGGVNTGYKCYGVKLGNTFHAFLNYRIADGQCGVMWATSTDMLNFTDQTSQLPQSGIIPPSGMTVSSYLSKISPYQFSGYENFSTIYPPNAVSGVPSGLTGRAFQTQPSGWIQASGIDGVWSGSGTFTGNYAADRTQWDVPMYYSARTKFLFPTWTKEPIAFTSGLVPTGVQFEGYRWNGVNNYHIFGIKDADEEKVHLFFSEDVLNHSGPGDNAIGGAGGQDPPDQVLYYTLDSNGTWTFKNQFKSRRLSWVTNTDLLDPSMLIGSGTTSHPFPYEDRTNQVVYQPFTIYDWPYFGKVSVEIQYSTDYGDTWHNATRHTTLSDSLINVDTGSIATDPSGTIGKSYMFAWDYMQDVGNNQFDWVQFRLRAVG